jgi:UbiD family decarboxylase
MPQTTETANQSKMPDDVVRRLVDIGACIDYLEEAGNLIRVKSPVSAIHELAGIAKKFEGTKCILFENIKDSKYPVFMGMLWSRDIVGDLFGIEKEKVPFVIADAIGRWQKDKGAFPSPIQKKGPANEVVEKDVDLLDLPIPAHALKDGGRYFDSSVVIVRNPETGGLNTSIHRLMVSGKDRLTFLIDPDRHLGEFLDIMEKKNKPLPVTINNGIGLVPWFVSVIPKQGDGKHEIANHLFNSSVNLIHAQTVDVPAYADAQFVIEAEILPNVREAEGPFAEVTGYYASLDKRWVMRVLAVTHREKPVFHSLLSGPEVWNTVGFTAEAKIFVTVKKKCPQLMAVHLDHGGCGFYGAVIQLNRNQAGDGKEAIQETFKAFPPLQRVVAVDMDVNLYDPTEVNWAITTRFDADKDLMVLKNQVGHILNPMVKKDPDGKGGTVTKIGIDATAPFQRREMFERVAFKEVNLTHYEIG